MTTTETPLARLRAPLRRLLPAALVAVLAGLGPATAAAQTKGQLSYNSSKDAGYLILRGRNDNNACRLSIDGSDNTRGFLELLDDGDRRAYLYVDSAGQGGLQLFASNGEEVAVMRVDDASENGSLELKEPSGTTRAVLKVDAADQGYLVLDGSDNSQRVRLSVRDGDDTGFLTLGAGDGSTAAEVGVDGTGQGYLVLDGSDSTQRARLGVVDDDDTGFLTLRDAGGVTKADLRVDRVGQGYLVLGGSDDTERARLSVRNAEDTGFLSLSGPGGVERAKLGVDSHQQGYLVLDGEDGASRARLSVRNNDDTGFLELAAADGTVRAELAMTDDGRGVLLLDGSGDVARARLSVDDDDAGLLQLGSAQGGAFVTAGAASGASPDQGSVRVFGLAPGTKALGLRGQMQADPATSSGTLVLYDAGGTPTIILDGDTGVISKSGMNGFLIPHPTNRTQEIFYASLEGPEAGVYARGSARLVAGAAEVELPPSFALVADPATVTVQLTPGSAETYGLGVTAKSSRRISVRELAGGTGGFSFDYMVTAARLDVEPFDPIRRRTTAPAAVPAPPPAVLPPRPDLPPDELTPEPAIVDREDRDAGEDGRPGAPRLRDAIDLEPVRDLVPDAPDLSPPGPPVAGAPGPDTGRPGRREARETHRRTPRQGGAS